jgi:hypothetical protein
LKFTSEATASQLAELTTILGEDCREHPEWGGEGLTSINLELTDDFTGIQWDGTEKTYELTECVNLILDRMWLKWPQFGLSGTLTAQGEEIEDRWRLTIDAHWRAIEERIALTGTVITCPHCGERIVLEDVEKEQC